MTLQSRNMKRQLSLVWSSIGTSWSTKKIGSGFFNTISQAVSFATNTEAKHKDFAHNIDRLNLRLKPEEQTEYYRFNAPTGDRDFNLDDWQQMGSLKVLTRRYLDEADTKDKIEKCARWLLRASATPVSPPTST